MKVWRLTQCNLWCSSQVAPTNFLDNIWIYTFIFNADQFCIFWPYLKILVFFQDVFPEYQSISSATQPSPTFPCPWVRCRDCCGSSLDVLGWDPSQWKLLWMIALFFLSVFTSHWIQSIYFHSLHIPLKTVSSTQLTRDEDKPTRLRFVLVLVAFSRNIRM